MVTCQRCGKNLVRKCSCFNGREKLKEFIRLTSKELEVIDKVQYENKPLYVELEEKQLSKKASIKFPNELAIQAEVKFTKEEIGNLKEYWIRLVDWNGELIYRRKHKPFLGRDVVIWKLEATSK